MGLYLDTPVQFIKGVGPRLSSILGRRGIYCVKDLFEWYPRAYRDYRSVREIASLNPGETVSLKAQVVGVRSQQLGRSKRRLWDIVVKDSSGLIHCKYFRTPYRGYFERFQPGMSVRVEGKVINYRGNIEFHHPDIRDDEVEEDIDKIVPLYTETEGLSAKKIIGIMKTAFGSLEEPIAETLPEWILKKYNLPSLDQTLRGIHMPDQESGIELSMGKSKFHRRIKFEEFFWMQMVVMARKMRTIRQAGVSVKSDWKESPVLEKLPFELTGAQKRTLEEVSGDLKKSHPMHRLVQGDVGSGKTAVALVSASQVIASGFQVALMAPTEILAEQHFENAKLLFEPLGYKVGFLSGSQKKAEKEEVLSKLKSGEIDLCVGTHALIQDTVEFKSLALAIVDEQHRFGVHQRRVLKSKGYSPHLLVMTATPIPRSLSMTLYGDLDVSIIDELPKGRQPIVTRVTYESKRRKVIEFMRTQLRAGRQAYVVYPLVEESEKIDLKNAMDEFEALKGEFSEFAVGLIHGKMKADEKDKVMESFRRNEIQALVSTTVIEVGVDVPNATFMLIEHAERFGLSQLHQLRGRVGRGMHKSYCVLMLGKAVSQESRERVQVMEETTDGFKIADKDLEIRGPGDFLGTRQSGLEGFKMANMVRDLPILVEARKAATELLERDPSLSEPAHIDLRAQLEKTDGYMALATSG